MSQGRCGVLQNLCDLDALQKPTPSPVPSAFSSAGANTERLDGTWTKLALRNTERMETNLTIINY